MLQALRARGASAPGRHVAELRWLDAALGASVAPHWIAHWAATRVDVWHGVAQVAGLLGDKNLQRLLQHEADALNVLVDHDAARVAGVAVTITDVAAAIARVAAHLAGFHRRAFATRDLCWAALALAVQQDPAKRQEAEQVAATVIALALADAQTLVIAFDDDARAMLLRPIQHIVPGEQLEQTLAPAYSAAAAAACSITIAQGYAMWRAALPSDSHTVRALDALLGFSEAPGFPQTVDIIAQGLDVALLRAAQLDALTGQLTDSRQGVTYHRALALTAELPACTSPTQVEMWVAARGLVDVVETVWWDVLGMVALAPLAAAAAHDAEPSARTESELMAAAQLAHSCFGHREAWVEVLRAPPLWAALQRCFAQMQGDAGVPLAGLGELTFAGTSAACRAVALRCLGELPPHPAAPAGWGNITRWLAALCDNVVTRMPSHGLARALRAWGQPVAGTAVVQMQVATPPVRDLVLPSRHG